MKYENISIKKLLKTVKKDPEIKQIKKAILFCEKELQTKQLQNALNGAQILNSLGMQGNNIAAILLFETKIKIEEITNEFNEDIKNLVKSVRKIKTIELQSKNFEEETLSKIILATTNDFRSIIIMLATKLCELRNATEKDQKLAKTVMNVYSPISQKLGLNEIKWELEDLSFKILNKKAYLKIKTSLKKKRKERETELKKIIKEIRYQIKKHGINAKVFGRIKNFYGIYKKMIKKKCNINELPDLIAIRIICDTIKECYILLGVIHSIYEPLLNSFDDYIATPKKNNYRSIHTDLKTKNGKIFEAQIRTWEMHADAEEGLPAHWAYKEIKKDREFDDKLTWAKQLIEWNRKNKSKKILETLKIGFEGKKIFTLTPRAEIVELPVKSTPVDFAYAIHSNLGSKCKRAKVNGKIVSLDHEIQNGDMVEISSSENQTPKRQWLTFVKTPKAKTKIRQFLQIKEKKTEKIKVSKISKKAIHSMRISKCCNPLPGDKIFAIKTTKRKLTIHRENCKNLERENPKKVIPINWEMIGKKELSTEIKIRAKEQVNLLTKILDVVSSKQGRVSSTHTKVENKEVYCEFVLQTKKPQKISEIIEEIRKIKGIIEIKRE